MRKIKEILRLKYESKLTHRQIGRSCGITHRTVAEYVRRAEAAELNQWPLPEEIDDAGLELRLFPPVAAPSSPRTLPVWAEVYEELQTHKHLTLQLVWQEYKQDQPEGYRYSRFCELYGRWTEKLDQGASFSRSFL